MSEFCPKAWAAICELCGGADRIDTGTQPIPGVGGKSEDIAMAVISDAFIVNVGSKEDAAKWAEASSASSHAQGESVDADGLTPAQQKLLDPHDRTNWHVDGDFFHHFLDSKEQALLPIVLFSDIAPGGGGTMICPEAIPSMAKHLYGHPEGLMPDMSTSDDAARKAAGLEPYEKFSTGFYDGVVRQVEKSAFRTATGRAGDVYLLHPLMVHSAAPNYLRGETGHCDFSARRELMSFRPEPRIITNPPVALREPFNFDRQDGSAYSLVEQKTLRSLGQPEGLSGWKISGERKLIVPERVKRQALMKKIGEPTPVKAESVHGAKGVAVAA